MKWEQDLTCLQASARVTDLWMSGTMLYKFKCVLLNTHKKCKHLASWHLLPFSKDKEFVSKTTNDSRIDLDKFPTSKVKQLAKKMEASKATVYHIEQVASYPQVTQINLMRHQWTDLPPSKSKRKALKSRWPSHKHHNSEQQVPTYKRKFDPKQAHTSKERCSKCGNFRHIEGFKCPVKKY